MKAIGVREIQRYLNNEISEERCVNLSKKNTRNYIKRQLTWIRGNNISTIFQEPMSSLNPLHTIEKQINEILMIHSKISYAEASTKSKECIIFIIFFYKCSTNCASTSCYTNN